MTLPKLIIRNLYLSGGRRNPAVARGALVRPYAGGPLGRYVGTSPSGVDYLIYLDAPNAEAKFDATCAIFDGKFGVRGLI